MHCDIVVRSGPIVTPTISKADPCEDRVYVNLNGTAYRFLVVRFQLFLDTAVNFPILSTMIGFHLPV